MTLIGTMQGRMVPPVDERIQAFPRDNWEEEFALSAMAGLDAIEWIYDSYGEDVNPLATAEGIARMRELSSQHGVSVVSVCADYLMERPLIRVTESERLESLDRLRWLLAQCGQLDIGRMVLPFVDNSAIDTPGEEKNAVDSLQSVMPVAEEFGIELHLETSLSPQGFGTLLHQLPNKLIKVTYDTGNSASLGYEPREEFEAYGGRVGSVHIKDRVLGGSTVPLGAGDTDFAAVFAGLREQRYAGDIILQVARGAAGDEVAWAKRNMASVAAWWPR